MAYSYARRKELAAAKLQALGVDARGRNPEKVWREATADLRQQAVTALAGRDRTYHGGGAYRPGRTVEQARERVRGLGGKAKQPLRQDVPAAGATVTTSKSQRAIVHALKEAQAKGHKVVVYATIDKGQGPRSRVIDGRGAQGDVLGAGGGGGGGAGDGGGGEVLGKLQIVAAPPGSPAFGGHSVDPGALLDYLSDYDDGDWWDAWYDLADAEYGEAG